MRDSVAAIEAFLRHGTVIRTRLRERTAEEVIDPSLILCARAGLGDAILASPRHGNPQIGAHAAINLRHTFGVLHVLFVNHLGYDLPLLSRHELPQTT